MEREEDIYTNTGINTPAALTLWKLVKDDVRLRNQVIKTISNYRHYYKCLSDIKNVKVRVHMIRMLYHESEKEVLDSPERNIETYFRNVMKYIYRMAILETQPDVEAENKKKLHSSVRSQYSLSREI